MERVVSAQTLLSQLDTTLAEHKNQLNCLPKDAPQTEVLQLESKVTNT